MLRAISLVLLLSVFTETAMAQTTAEQPQVGATLPPYSPLEALGSDYENSIKLLQNRFRIDYNVDEITMIFFREYGSAPIVLVRPDGSKIFQSQVDGEKVFWYDSDNYDMISIKHPVPGPWQAVGQILPGSRVMVLSDVQLHAESLPTILFSGEILKQTAYLTNGDKPVDYSEFRDVVELTIELVSTNNPNYDNFGATNQLIATFEDNGRGMDEAPLDGVFTGQFNLAVPAGEWKPVFRVTTPMFTREQVDPPIRLYPNPVKLDVTIDGGGNDYHKLKIDVDRTLVDINSLLIDGKVRYPNGDIQNFSLTEPNGEAREHLIVAFDYGIFRVKLTAYGKTVNGRDFILDVPEYSFLVAEPELPEPMVGGEADPNAATMADEATSEQNQEEGEDSHLLSILLLVNGSILIVGILVIGGIVIVRKRTGNNVSNEGKTPDPEETENTANGFLARLVKGFKKTPKA
jgi:uncharacterized protein (TIGR03503 family)